jgi:hypothetical protein
MDSEDDLAPLRQGYRPWGIRKRLLVELRKKLIKIGRRPFATYATFRKAEVAMPRRLFAAILGQIERLRLRLPQAGIG